MSQYAGFESLGTFSLGGMMEMDPVFDPYMLANPNPNANPELEELEQANDSGLDVADTVNAIGSHHSKHVLANYLPSTVPILASSTGTCDCSYPSTNTNTSVFTEPSIADDVSCIMADQDELLTAATKCVVYDNYQDKTKASEMDATGLNIRVGTSTTSIFNSDSDVQLQIDNGDCLNTQSAFIDLLLNIDSPISDTNEKLCIPKLEVELDMDLDLDLDIDRDFQFENLDLKLDKDLDFDMEMEMDLGLDLDLDLDLDLGVEVYRDPSLSLTLESVSLQEPTSNIIVHQSASESHCSIISRGSSPTVNSKTKNHGKKIELSVTQNTLSRINRYWEQVKEQGIIFEDWAEAIDRAKTLFGCNDSVVAIEPDVLKTSLVSFMMPNYQTYKDYEHLEGVNGWHYSATKSRNRIPLRLCHQKANFYEPFVKRDRRHPDLAKQVREFLCPYCPPEPANPDKNFYQSGNSHYYHHLCKDHGVYNTGKELKPPLVVKHNGQSKVVCYFCEDHPVLNRVQLSKHEGGTVSNPFISYFRHCFECHREKKKGKSPLQKKADLDWVNNVAGDVLIYEE